MEQDDDGPVEVGRVAAPRLAGLQGRLAGLHLPDGTAEDGHDITELDWGRGRPDLASPVPVPAAGGRGLVPGRRHAVVVAQVGKGELSPGPTCTRTKGVK